MGGKVTMEKESLNPTFYMRSPFHVHAPLSSTMCPQCIECVAHIPPS